MVPLKCAAFSEVLEADFMEEAKIPQNVGEVRNFVRAAEYGVDEINRRPISSSLLCELHEILVRGTPADSYQAGRLRETPVVVGPDSCRVTEARFIPNPPGDTLISGVSAWEKWLNEPNEDLPILARIAVGHYQFETLYPFNDGNGRLGRLVALLQLIDGGQLTHPVLNVSPWLASRRKVYHDHLAEVSATGDFNPWVQFFVECVAATSRREVERIGKLMALRTALGDRARAVTRSVAIEIAESLVGFPVLSVAQAAENHGVSYQTANAAVAKLVDMGILVNVGDRSYDRVFMAREVLQVLES